MAEVVLAKHGQDMEQPAGMLYVPPSENMASLTSDGDQYAAAVVENETVVGRSVKLVW